MKAKGASAWIWPPKYKRRVLWTPHRWTPQLRVMHGSASSSDADTPQGYGQLTNFFIILSKESSTLLQLKLTELGSIECNHLDHFSGRFEEDKMEIACSRPEVPNLRYAYPWRYAKD
ncbi:hypothetical protein AVEN_30224-1 [Araneus ventricosus]|uniref:Uncharacterized protein n=1 Tax=Araneus ventricosus TaxID=182803 RepID=A0A4Y2LFE2_ARAVE|nr:hypothetical protein AVEN_30224-1 [Araneus ventricosus]